MNKLIQICNEVLFYDALKFALIEGSKDPRYHHKLSCLHQSFSDYGIKKFTVTVRFENVSIEMDTMQYVAELVRE